MASPSERERIDRSITNHRGPGIVTGMVELADPADLAPFRELFGAGPEFEGNFNLYFHWYNVIHELAHISRRSVGLLHLGTTAIQEEKYANDFAVAYWRHQGEHIRLQVVEGIVSKALGHTIKTCPSEDILQHYKEPTAFYEAGQNPREYAYVQFSMVLNALREATRGFVAELSGQGFRLQQATAEQEPEGSGSSEPMQLLVDRAVDVLRTLGIELGRVLVFPHYNPNQHRII